MSRLFVYQKLSVLSITLSAPIILGREGRGDKGACLIDGNIATYRLKYADIFQAVDLFP